MVIIPVSGGAAHTVPGWLYFVGDDRHDTSPVVSVPVGRIDGALYGNDVPDLAGEERLCVGTRSAVLHLYPSCIRKQRLILLGISGSDSTAGLPSGLRRWQQKVGQLAVPAQVIPDNLILGEYVQLALQELLCLRGALSLPD